MTRAHESRGPPDLVPRHHWTALRGDELAPTTSYLVGYYTAGRRLGP